MMGLDRRSRIRYDLDFPVMMTTSQGIVRGRVKNFSGTGAFICCQQPLKTEDTVDLSIMFPDGLLMEVPAQVVWSRTPDPGDEETLNGMGVRFLWEERGVL